MCNDVSKAFLDMTYAEMRAGKLLAKDLPGLDFYPLVLVNNHVELTHQLPMLRY